MAQLMLNHLDDVMIEKFAALASENHMSLEEQAKKLLSDAVSMADRRRDLLEIADWIAAMTPKGVKQTDSTLLIREDRDS